MQINFLICSIDWPNSHSPAEECCIKIAQCILYYRGIYILNTGSNTVFGKLFLPFIKAVVVFGLILSFFAVVEKYEYLDTLSLFFVSAVTPTAFLLLAPISIVMSSLYDMSSQFHRNIFPKVHRVTIKKTKRILIYHLKSCPLIRCQVGNLYHMEAKAKLTMLHHVLNGVVFLMVNAK